MLHLSYLSALYATHQAVSVPSFRDLANYFERCAGASYARKEDIPLLSPCTFIGDTSLKSAELVTAIALDVDSVTPDEADALFDALEPFEYVAHETFQHTPDAPRYRVWVSLAHPIAASDWKRAYAHLQAAFPYIDRKCKNPNRFYYLPCNDADVFHNLGKFYDVPTTPIVPIADAPAHDVSKAQLRRLAASLKSSQSHKRQAFGAILETVLDGLPYAKEGERDDLTYRLCYYIAEKFPNGDPQHIAARFHQSLALMGDHGLDVAKKLERQQAIIRTEQDRKASDQEQARDFDISRAFGTDRTDPYTPDELKALAVKHRVTPNQLRKVWVIQKGESYWVLTPHGYRHFTRSDAALAASVLLSPAPLSLYDMGGTAQNPRIEVKPIARMVSEFGSTAQDVHTHLALPTSYFSPPAWTYHEAACSLAPLEPLDRFDIDFVQISLWLEKLSGPNMPLLRKWLYWLQELRSPCAALFLTGTPGSGKSLLAAGLARLWGNVDPTPLDRLMASFNDSVMSCPLIFADESLPKDFKGNVRTAELRELIQARTRSLKRKYVSDTTLHGSIRLIMAGNNEELLQFKESNLNENDISAITERIIHVYALPAATEYLKSLQPGVIHRWVSECKIARYALAMPEALPEGRFLVAQQSDYVYNAILTNSVVKFALLQWLHNLILEPSKIMTMPGMPKHISISKTGVFVHFKAVEDTWNIYSKGVCPYASGISKELSSLGHRAKIPGSSVNCYKINLKHLYAWTERDGSCSVEDMRKIIDGGISFGKDLTVN